MHPVEALVHLQLFPDGACRLTRQSRESVHPPLLIWQGLWYCGQCCSTTVMPYILWLPKKGGWMGVCRAPKLSTISTFFLHKIFLLVYISEPKKCEELTWSSPSSRIDRAWRWCRRDKTVRLRWCGFGGFAVRCTPPSWFLHPRSTPLRNSQAPPGSWAEWHHPCPAEVLDQFRPG